MSNTKNSYGNTKVDEALDLLQAISMTRADFLDLAMACLDQGGLSVRGQDVVRQAIGMDALRADPIDDIGHVRKIEKSGRWS